MKIPKYWAQESRAVQGQDGYWLRMSAWRWSDFSTDDARQNARARVKELVAKVQRGEILDRYSYGDRPLREEAIRSIAGNQNRELGLITRNSYGSLVLNAPQAMFIDIDFSDEGPAVELLPQLGRLFGRKPAKPASTPEERAVASIQQWAARNPGVGLRVYRTAGGVRGLITSDLFDPAQETTLNILRELQADPLYTRLCRNQECFRARLSPKHWRCDIAKPPSRWPWADAGAESQYRAWDQKYNAAASRYDVCRLLAQIGNPNVHPDVQPILDQHDQACISGRNLPLA